MVIPKEISANHVTQAAQVIEGSGLGEFGEATKYEAIVEGRRYPPKALIGFAAEFAIGKRLKPADFSSGEAPGQAVGFLRNLGFEVVSKNRKWWVNQNQTFKSEFEGGYLWSPKRNRNGARNQFYENMRFVCPGDTVYSFRDTKIVALGTATSHCYDSPKPVEFGTAGENWDTSGWRVDVSYEMLPHPIRPKDNIEEIRPFLPDKYSPLQTNGDGLQSVYLAEVNEKLSAVLERLLRSAGNSLGPARAREMGLPKIDAITEFEDQLEQALEAEPTEKEQLVKSRRGQGKFRQNVLKLEKACRITGVTDSDFLIASHIKPWRHADNRERLDGANGLMLTPNVDHLFDAGFISFADDGELLVASVIDAETLSLLGVFDTSIKYGSFTEKQAVYLKFHREEVWLGAG